jgi:ribulose 1,5-bisphosphate synthetase/thiazole synthase
MISRVAAAVLAAFIFAASSRSIATAAAARPDVLVVGGTPAGVAAAIAAARHGENVTLVAGRPVLGGVLTDATMDQWDLNLAPDGASVEGGIFDEIHAALGDAFTAADAARVFGELAASEPRIHTILNAEPVAVRVGAGADGKRIEDVTFARTGTRSGDPAFTLAAGSVIDATDDADVAALAGARYDVGRQDTGIDEKMQAVTLMFTIDGVDWADIARGYDVATDGPGGVEGRRAWGYAKLMDGYRPLSADVLVRDLNLGREDDGSISVNAIDVLGIDGRSAGDLARARAIAEAEAPHLTAYLRERLAGFAAARVGGFADAVYVRETRHVLGDAWLTADDVWDGVMPADRIGLSSYPLDLHPVTATDRLAYAPVRHVYGVPFGALVPRGFSNLLLASPAISASHEASGSARVIPTTIEEGEADGVAAALANERGLSFSALAASPEAIASLQTDLRRDGAILDYAAPATIAYRNASGR